jgi:hypothetical protein
LSSIRSSGYVSALRFVAQAFGAVAILASAISLVAPDLRLSFERSLITPAGLYVFAVGRIALGLVFVFAAPASRAPRMVRALGFIVIIAGVMTPVFGVTRALAMLDWMANSGPFLMHIDAVVGITLGAFLLYVFRARSAQAT